MQSIYTHRIPAQYKFAETEKENQSLYFSGCLWCVIAFTNTMSCVHLFSMLLVWFRCVNTDELALTDFSQRKRTNARDTASDHNAFCGLLFIRAPFILPINLDAYNTGFLLRRNCFLKRKLFDFLSNLSWRWRCT